jgi:5-methylcytosine-specific restriction endonuclease McrA
VATNKELRRQAIEEGLSRFDPAGPCIHGHMAQRWVSSGCCVACSKVRYTYGPLPRRRTDEERRIALVAQMEEEERKSAAHWIWKAERNKVIAQTAHNARRARKAGSATGCRKAYAAFVQWARASTSIPCRWCNRETTPTYRHIDHIIPLSKGGSDSVDNLCVACPDCNMAKSSKLPEDFLREKQLAI